MQTVQEVELDMRKQGLKVKVGDKVIFKPDRAKLMGDRGKFFNDYRGKTAEVLGFHEDPVSKFLGDLANVAEPQAEVTDTEQLFEPSVRIVATEPKERKPVINYLFVRFEDGHTPGFAIDYLQFVVP